MKSSECHRRPGYCFNILTACRATSLPLPDVKPLERITSSFNRGVLVAPVCLLMATVLLVSDDTRGT